MLQILVEKRKNIYWLSQISGWGAYSLSYLLIFLTLNKTEIYHTLFFIIIFFAGILFSHFYRMIIKKGKWVELELNNLIPRVLLASSITGTVIFATSLLLFYLFDPSGITHLGAGVILIHLLNLTVILLLWSFIYFTVHFLENYQRSEIERLIWEAAVKDFEIKTLKSQLNPHFMFNAMNGIRALIEEDPQKAKTAITKLSNIFRYSLKIERTETVPLDEEIKTVIDYLSLEQVRFEERLNYETDIDNNVLGIEIPPMMVQTLVENGIKHGISKLTKGGIIKISAKKENGLLVIKILNSGSLSEKDLKDAKGFGVANTIHRLSLLYGEKASFKISNNNGFVEALIKIPTGGTLNASYNN